MPADHQINPVGFVGRPGSGVSLPPAPGVQPNRMCQALVFVLALAGIQRLVAQTKAFEKDDSHSGGWWCCAGVEHRSHRGLSPFQWP